MLDYDEIVVFVVDENGKELKKTGPVQWSKDLRVGQHVLLRLDPETAAPPDLFHILGIRPGEGRGRFVQAIVAGAIEQDSTGLFVTCQKCHKRVAFEQLPTRDGEPSLFRISE